MARFKEYISVQFQLSYYVVPTHSHSRSSESSSLVSSKRSIKSDPLPIPKHVTSRGPSEQFRSERERAHGSLSRAELLKLLITAEYEVKQTKKVSVIALDRLRTQTERANENETTALDATQVLKVLMDDKRNLERELEKSRDEFKGLSQQFGEAQSNIIRAQGVVDDLTAELDAAEEKAKETRQVLRQIERERDMEEVRRVAFLDGKREGQMAGFDHGRQLGWKEHARHARRAAARAAGTTLSPEGTFDDDDYPFERGIAGGPTFRHHDNRRLSGPIPERAPSPHANREAPPPPPPARENGTRSRSSSRAQGQQQQQPPRPPSSPRPSSTHTQRNLPPDGFIPTLSADGHGIQLPPPFELKDNPITVGSRSASPSAGPSRPAPGPVQPPPRRTHRRQNSADSGVSALTSLGELLTTPTAGANATVQPAAGNLSTIIEASDSGQTMGSPSRTLYSRSHTQAPEFGRDLSFNTPSSATGPNLAMDAFDRQRIADELRYSDPTLAEEWRRHPAYEGAANGGPPSSTRRPAVVTAPAPLGPPGMPQHRASASTSRGQQRQSMSSEGSMKIHVVPPVSSHLFYEFSLTLIYAL